MSKRGGFFIMMSLHEVVLSDFSLWFTLVLYGVKLIRPPVQ